MCEGGAGVGGVFEFNWMGGGGCAPMALWLYKEIYSLPIIQHCSQCITVNAILEEDRRSRDDRMKNISCKSSDACAHALSDYCELFFVGIPP